MTDKDVHTEHCCSDHGCKYGDEDCSVKTGQKTQSFPCEYCDSEAEERAEQIVYVLYRIESHRDREMTFLGLHSSLEKAEAAQRKHQESGKSPHHPDGWPRWEYTILRGTVDGWFDYA